MSGYAVSARIPRTAPRVVRHDPEHGARDARVPTAEVPEIIVIQGGPLRGATAAATDSIAERWGRFRDRWAQLTFYATDPDSWR